MENVPVPIKVSAEVKADLGDATKLGGKIVKSIEKACGVLYEPIGTVRTARAEAAAALIKAESKIEIHDKLQRARTRFVKEHLRQQANIDAIVVKALEQQEPEQVSQEACDEDWINEFFDCAKNVSNDQMQELLAKLLAGEVAQPGRFSRRTVHLVRTLSRIEVEAFTSLLTFAWRVAEEFIIIPRDEYSHPSDENPRPEFNAVLMCQSIGLIHDASVITLVEKTALAIADRRHVVADGKKLAVHGYSLTSAGTELANVVPVTVDEPAYLFWLNAWRPHLATHPDSPHVLPGLPEPKLEKLSDDSISEGIHAALDALNYWAKVIETVPEPKRSNRGWLWVGNKVKVALDRYRKLRGEAIRRDPDSEATLPDFSPDPDDHGDTSSKP